MINWFIIKVAFVKSLPFTFLNMVGGLDSWESRDWGDDFITSKNLHRECLYPTALSP